MSLVGLAATQTETTLVISGVKRLPALIARASKTPVKYGRPWLFGPNAGSLPTRFQDRVEFDDSIEFWPRHLQTAAAVFSKAATCFSNNGTYRAFNSFYEQQIDELAHPDVAAGRAWDILNLVRGIFVALRYDDDIDGLPAFDRLYTDRAREVLAIADTLLVSIGRLEKALLRQTGSDVTGQDLIGMFEECKASRGIALARRNLLAPFPQLPSFPQAVPLTTLLYQVSGEARLQIKQGALRDAAAGVQQSVAMARVAAESSDGNKTAQYRYWDNSPYMQAGLAVSNAVSTIHMMNAMYEMLLSWDDAKFSSRTAIRIRSSVTCAQVHAGSWPNIWHNSFAHTVLVWGLFCHHSGRQDAAYKQLARARQMFSASGDGYRAREVDAALAALRQSDGRKMGRERIMRMIFEMPST